jgi:hypothetical protein
MALQPTFEQMEDKREVTGFEYREGEWTGRWMQVTLLCKHKREAMTNAGWLLNETSRMLCGAGCTSRMQYIPDQKCEHAKA